MQLELIRLCRFAMVQNRAVGIAFALAFSLGFSAGAPALAGEVSASDGVTYVRNGDVSENGLQTVIATELWRAGGEDDEVFFGAIGRVLADADGNIYLMDSQLSEVAVYSPQGEYLRTLSREGEGPGEVRSPNDMFFLQDGTLGLIQMFPGKIVKINLDGTPAGVMNYSVGDPSQGRFSVLLQGSARGGNLLLLGIRMNFSPDGLQEQIYFLSRCDENGTEQHTYAKKENTINYSDFVLAEEDMDFVYGRFDLGPDGKVYVVPDRNRYAVNVYQPSGQLERVIEREYVSWKRQEEDTKLARQAMEAIGRNYPVPPREVTVLDTEPNVTSLRVASDGSIWATTSRGDREPPKGAMTVVDVFDAEGHFQSQKALMIPGDARKDAIFFLEPDRAVVVTRALDAFLSRQGVSAAEGEEAEDVPMEVICYQLEM